MMCTNEMVNNIGTGTRSLEELPVDMSLLDLPVDVH